MKRPGATREETEREETKNLIILGKFKEFGEYHHRCLLGPKRRESIFYPTFRRDFDTQELVPSYNQIVVPPLSTGFKSILDTICNIDKKVQISKGINRGEVNSKFRRTVRYVYIVLSRDLTTDGKPWVGAWEYPIGVSEKVTKFQLEVSTKDRTKLRYGPYWTWDLIVERYEDKQIASKTTEKLRTVKYSVQVDPECMPVAGKVPIEAVEDPEFFDKHPDMFKEICNQVFTAEELDIINTYNLDLNTIVTPVKSNEEIVSILNEFPINLNATDANGNPLFRFKEELYEEIVKLGNRLIADYNVKKLPEATKENVEEFQNVESAAPEKEVVVNAHPVPDDEDSW